MIEDVPSLRPAVLRLVRDAANWEALDRALQQPFTLDFKHRGSTMRVTISSPHRHEENPDA